MGIETRTKETTESRRYNFDFSRKEEIKDDGETIVSAVVESEPDGLTLVGPGVDPDGKIVQVVISDGDDGEVYHVKCTGTTNETGSVLVVNGRLKVADAHPD